MHISQKVFFYLIQSECGDLYKVTLATGDGSEVLDIDVRYFDTVPVANSLCIMRSGHLYVASEFSDTYVTAYAYIYIFSFLLLKCFREK